MFIIISINKLVTYIVTLNKNIFINKGVFDNLFHLSTLQQSGLKDQHFSFFY